MKENKQTNLQILSAKKHLEYALKESRIFGDLKPELLHDLVESMSMFTIEGGETLYKEADASDSLAIVVSGRFIISKTLKNGQTEILGEIGPGSSVGELGLILQQPRAASVIANRDSSIASLNREHFEALLRLHPVSFNRAITRTVFEFTLNKRERPARIGATTIAIIPVDRKVATGELTLSLVQALAAHGKIHHFSPEEGQKFYTETNATQQSSHFLSNLEQAFDYLVFETSLDALTWSNFAIRQADQILFVGQADTTAPQPRLPIELMSSVNLTPIKKSIILLHANATDKPNVDPQWLNLLNFDRLYPIRSNNQADIDRLGRFITGNAIGLVLGGGGARGLAHIGVLKALNEAKIPIDIICGNSMGALIAAQYANGTSIDELLSTTKSFVKSGDRPTLPLFSLLAGKTVKKGIKKLFSETSIEGLWCPFFAISCNLSQANIRVHDKGLLWKAVLASNSPTGILPPVIQDGEFFVDAALLDNVPVKAMRQKIGFGCLIAVDVDVREELKVDANLSELSSWQVLKQRIFNREAPRLPSIFDLLHRSGHLGGLVHRKESIAMADHYLQPPVSKFSLMAYGKGTDIVDTGYQYTLLHIDNLKASLKK
ncbi:MAG: cyclic nucleotide-binding and patatin-like phospholipase domain-containing protein [Colwellia sp.]